jgi:hypothetical protein
MLPFLFVLSTILLPLLMFALRRRPYAWGFDLLGAVAALTANLSAGLHTLEIKLEGTEFTTHIHEVFMDPFFLASVAYLGLYAVYRFLVTAIRHRATQS